MTTKQIIRIVVLSIIAVFAIITLFSSVSVVSTGETGILVRFGQVQGEALTPGMHVKLPYVDSVKIVSNKQTELTYDGKVWSESAEQTPVYYENITVSYQIEPSASIRLFSTVDENIVNNGKTLITPTVVASAIKNAAVTLTTKNVTNRNSIEPLATKELQTSLNEKYGEGAVTVIKLSILNADFEAEYNAVIAERQAAQIKQEQQTIENQTAIEKAKADAEAARLTAQGEADSQKIKTQSEAEMQKIKAEANAESIKIEAEAQSEANKKILESLEDEILIANYIEKWNGTLPTVTGSESGMILDIESLLKNEN